MFEKIFFKLYIYLDLGCKTWQKLILKWNNFVEFRAYRKLYENFQKNCFYDLLKWLTFYVLPTQLSTNYRFKNIS